MDKEKTSCLWHTAYMHLCPTGTGRQNGLRKRGINLLGSTQALDRLFYQQSGSSYIQQETSSCSNIGVSPCWCTKVIKNHCHLSKVQIKKVQKSNYVQSKHECSLYSHLNNIHQLIEKWWITSWSSIQHYLLHTFNVTGPTKSVKVVLPTFCAHLSWNLGGQIKKEK